jgi:hypothetical protein
VKLTAIAGSALLAVSLFALSPKAEAGSVAVNGGTYVCQNTCIVSANSNGTFTVTDSGGGWVYFLANRIKVTKPGARTASVMEQAR